MSDESDFVPITQGAMLLALHSKPQANTKDEYVASLLNYLTMRFTMRTLGSSLIDINRRFGHLGTKFKLSPRNVVMLLESRGDLLVDTHKRKLVLFPTVPYREWEALYGTDVEALWDAKVSLMERSCEE